MKREEIRLLVILNVANKLGLSEKEVSEAIEKRTGHTIVVLRELNKQRIKYTKIINDYLKMVKSVVNASTITYEYSKDKKYLDEVEGLIDKIENKFKNNKGR